MPIKKDPNDPRVRFRNHKERGPKRWSYSYESIGEAAGLEASSARFYGATDRGGRFDPDDLKSVAFFIAGRAARDPSRTDRNPISDDKVKALLGEQGWAMWENRWPRIELYECHADGCEVPLLSHGLCFHHGGGWPMVRIAGQFKNGVPCAPFDPSRIYLELRLVGTYKAYHRLLMGDPAGKIIHHKDGNKLNNRYENLEVMTPAEHALEHSGLTPRLIGVPGYFVCLECCSENHAGCHMTECRCCGGKGA